MSETMMKAYGLHYLGSPFMIEMHAFTGRLDNLIKEHIHDGKIRFDVFVIRSCCNKPHRICETSADVNEDDLKNARQWLGRSGKDIPSYDKVAIKFKKEMII